MSDDQVRAQFLADILANPGDDGPRLVYADWLIQRGEPRGELIVTQCQLEQATGLARMELVNRASDLLYREGTWLTRYKEVVRGVETKRGFVYAINAKASVFAKSCAPWFELEPIEELRVIAPSGRDLVTLRKAKHLARLRSLVFLDPIALDTALEIAALAELLAATTVRAMTLRLVLLDDLTAAACEAFARIASPTLATMKLHVSPPQAIEPVTAALQAAFPNATITQIGNR